MAGPLREQLVDWAAAQTENLASARPKRVDGLRDRTQESWTLLFAIADAAGGDWPQRARSAAVALASGARGDESDGIRLLSDIREIFLNRDDEGKPDQVEQLTSVSLLEALWSIDEAPWGDWFGKKITSRAVTKLLRNYGLPGTSSSTIKVQDENGKRKSAKGYKREQFEDVWSRFLPVSEGATGATGANPRHAAEKAENEAVPSDPAGTGSEAAQTRMATEVAPVATGKAANEGESGPPLTDADGVKFDNDEVPGEHAIFRLVEHNLDARESVA